MTGPIGVFDSGLGGLTVAGEILRRLPNESIIYFADTAHVPYGERPLEEIKGFAVGITRFLIDRGVKSLVMACNMSSAVALESAREAFPDLPILGVIEPGSQAAVSACGGVIGILATTGTVESGAYTRTIRRLAPEAEVYEQACPAFVPLVEAGLTDTEEAEEAAREYLEPLLLARARTIVLGCTHYPFLRGVISRVAPQACIVDPAEETVNELQKVLLERGLRAGPGERKEHVFFASGDTEGFARLGSRFLRQEISSVERAEWGMDLFAAQTAASRER
ncbi:MAG: glutamate racemase [Armatimonadetes bacterium]|nr:glutamate racemase [Armatimonadota bacterium]